MATVFKVKEREFNEVPRRIDGFRLYTDVSRIKKGVEPQYLNFDLRQLNPGQYSAPYHFHRYAEELFMIVSGSATLRTPDGLEVVESGDILFFELGEDGATSFSTMEPSLVCISISAHLLATMCVNIRIRTNYCWLRHLRFSGRIHNRNYSTARKM